MTAGPGRSSAAAERGAGHVEVGLRNRPDQRLSTWAATLDAVSNAPVAEWVVTSSDSGPRPTGHSMHRTKSSKT